MFRFISCRSLVQGSLLLLATGCHLGFKDDAATSTARNECDSNDQCGGGKCDEGICHTLSTDLGALLLYVTPATGTPIIAGVGFTQIVENFDFDLGPKGYEISLGHVSRLLGPVRATTIKEENCVIDASMPLGIPNEDGSVAARLTLTPRTRQLGIASPSYTLEVSDTGSSSYAVDLSVPPGRYDIYVEPQTTEAGCIRPPFLAVDQDIPSGDVNLGITLPEPTALDVKVRYPGGGTDLRGWTLEMIERTSGRRLSNLALLSESTRVDDGWEYSARLSFSEVAGQKSNPSSELVRLSPPKDVVGPQVYVERSVVELFQGGDGLIDQLTELPIPVSFGARVATNEVSESVQASVLFLATGLDSTGPGTVAAFSKVVDTDEDGLFEAQLLPGTYRVITEPRDESLEPIETEVKVSNATTQAGRTIRVTKRRGVRGQLVDFNDDAVSGTSVVMSAANPAPTFSVLELAQGRQTFSPAATRVATGEDGRFSLLSDLGKFHITSRPTASSGYPWQVRLGATVDGDELNLGRLRVSLPVVVSGLLTSQDIGDIVPEALIVAYAMLKDGEPVADSNEANQVTPVGETRVGEDGRFRMLLPSFLE